MDQLKTQLAMVKQHSFWAMCLGILGVSIGSWWVSTSKLATEQAAQVGKIKGGFESVKGVMGVPLHPNQSVIDGMDAVNRKYAKEVLDGWQLQYDQQAGVLVWPASFEQTGFLAFVDKLRPIEKVPVSADGKVAAKDDLPRDFKEEYRNYIEKELPKLAEKIKSRWVVSSLTSTPGGVGGEGGFGGGFGGGGVPGGGGFSPGGGVDASGVPLVDDSVVVWNSANQDEILKTHYGFTMKETLPSILEVLYAQEDYWVLDNIMQIIRETNKVDDDKDAEARHDAVVKYIDFVRIGRSAYGLAGMVTPIGRGATAGGEGGMAGSEGGAAPPAGGEGGAAPMPGGGGEGGMGGMEQMLARDPAINRYVDDKYQPLAPDRLRGALKSTTPEDALLAVAKRMPVRLRLIVDQRKLNVLLAKCGNSKLPLEVRQVRINRPAAAPGVGGGGMGGMGGEGGMPGGGGFAGGGGGGFGGGGFGGGGFGGEGGGGLGGLGGFGGGGLGGVPGGGMGGMGGGMPGGEGGFGGGGAMGRQGTGNVAADATVDNNLIPVELYGIVYIYNPANKDQLVAGAPPEGGAPTTDPNATPTDPNATPADPNATPAPTPDGTTPAVEAAAGLNNATPATEATGPAPGAQ